ncbi:hypothetical protein Niako_2706 [Niastella koreensis GR20-10]|uniref:Uncharacterized protein n=1 Tax=Niastella koreensis (strain DSM 17620 / KACC 11465 / NBRC 106392 / GR20-10) TaxID=700598 RepID=G8T723_NIAKG|nr:hypothetical protein Niako_2706 [Niastella koreensis GR20-10]
MAVCLVFGRVNNYLNKSILNLIIFTTVNLAFKKLQLTTTTIFEPIPLLVINQ